MHVVTQIVATGIGFIASFLVARYFGPSVVGNVATITSLFSLLGLIALVGNQSLALKVIPQQLIKGGHHSGQATYKKLLINSTCAAIILTSIWALAEHFFPFSLLKGMQQYLYLTMLLIFINVYFILNGKVLRGLGDYKYFTLLDFLPAAMSLVVAIAAIALKISGESYQVLHFLPRLALVALSFFLVLHVFNKIRTNEIADAKTFAKDTIPSKQSLLRSSFPMLGITISTASILHLDILMLNNFSTPSLVGVYSIYVKIAGVAAMATVSINSMFAPKVATLYTEGDTRELKEFSKQVTLILFCSIIALTTAILIIHRPLLSYYGVQFLGDLPALYTLLASNIIAAFFGSVGFYLNMTGHQKTFFWVILCAAILNALLNYILIPIYDINGAAIATLLATLVSAVIATFRIKALHGYTLVWTHKRSIR